MNKTKRDRVYKFISNDTQILEAATNICHRYCHLDPNDLIQELYLHIDQLGDDKLSDMIENDYIKWYCLKFFSIQTMSYRSPFIYKYQSKAKYTDCVEDLEIPDQIPNNEYDTYKLFSLKLITEEYKPKMHWYDRFIFFDLYIQEKLSIDKISKKLDIPNSSIKSTIRKIKDDIKLFIINNNKRIIDNI